ncbi:hypothetical protein PENTCL1PPCAC_28409, partial [Pristionchus entomophagus]
KRGCTTFMIECEKCEAWLHDTCVQIDEKMSRHIDHYFCDRCVAEHGVQITYKSTYAGYMAKRERAAKAAKTRKLKKEMEQAMNDVKLGKKEDEEEPMDEKDHEPRNPRCDECINCARTEDCGKCYYCRASVGRCLDVFCFTEVMNKPKTPEPPPLVSPKGSAKRKTQRKRKSGGDSDEDELFFSESTSTRKQIKKEISYKEEQQMVDVEVDKKKKKRGRKKGWRKAVDGKKTEEVVKKDITRVGKDAEFEKENGPENAQFDRPGYDTTVGERLDLASTAYAQHQQETGQVTENKRGKCKNDSCEKERADQDNYCGEECGMMAAQAHLQKAGFLAKPTLLSPPKKKRSYQAKKAANDENKRIEAIAAQQEADYLERKKKQEAERESDEEDMTDETDLVAATIRRLQREAAKSQRAQDEQRLVEEALALKKRQEEIMAQIKRQEAADQERRRTEAAEAAELERKRAEAEAQYRALTTYMSVSAPTALENALQLLIAQAVLRQQQQAPMPGHFPGSLFNPLLLNTAGFNLDPSLPHPILSSLNKAMMDHNDYLMQPILNSTSSSHNNSPPTNSTPSSLSNPSTSAMSSPFVPSAAPAPSPLVFNTAPFVMNPPQVQFPVNVLGDADALALFLNFTNSANLATSYQ